MAFASLGSGSTGNATLIRAGATLVLIDCGLGPRTLRRHFARLGISAEQLSGVFITHAHSDHSSGAAALARASGAPIYATAGTCHRLGDTAQGWQHVRAGAPLSIGAMVLQPTAVPHDCSEPVAYTVRAFNRKIGVLSDLGWPAPHVIEAFHGCHGLLLEANYDPDLLQAGPYPAFLKRRVEGRLGHLSNEQRVALFEALRTDALEALVIGHISQKNNTPRHAAEAFGAVVHSHVDMRLATAKEGTDWITLSVAENELIAS